MGSLAQHTNSSGSWSVILDCTFDHSTEFKNKTNDEKIQVIAKYAPQEIGVIKELKKPPPADSYLSLLSRKLSHLTKKSTTINDMVNHLNDANLMLLTGKISMDVIVKVTDAVKSIHDALSVLSKENSHLKKQNEELKFKVELLKEARKIRAPEGSDIEKAALQVATLKIKKLIPEYKPNAKRGRKKAGFEEDKTPEQMYIEDYISPALKKIGLGHLAEEKQIYSAVMPDFYKQLNLKNHRERQKNK